MKATPIPNPVGVSLHSKTVHFKQTPSREAAFGSIELDEILVYCYIYLCATPSFKQGLFMLAINFIFVFQSAHGFGRAFGRAVTHNHHSIEHPLRIEIEIVGGVGRSNSTKVMKSHLFLLPK